MATVTHLDPARHTPNDPSPDQRLVDAGWLARGAADLIAKHGHHTDDLGSRTTGFSLAGAVYTAADIEIRDGHLREIQICSPCRAKRQRGGGRSRRCRPGCEQKVWERCQLTFACLAAALATPAGKQIQLGEIPVVPLRDHAAVHEANGRLDASQAYTVLMQVWAATQDLYHGKQPVRRGRP